MARRPRPQKSLCLLRAQLRATDMGSEEIPFEVNDRRKPAVQFDIFMIIHAWNTYNEWQQNQYLVAKEYYNIMHIMNA